MDELKVSYRSLLRVSGVTPLYATSLASRMAAAMWLLTLTLLALGTFRSPQLAGLVGFASLAPALPVGLLAGTLLDRHGRRWLMAADQLLSFAVTAVTLVALAEGLMSPVLLVALTALGAVTLPLTQIGTRSLKPLLIPSALWDRANGLDNAITGLATVAGAGLAGLLLGESGPLAALASIALLWLIGAICAMTTPDVRASAAADRSLRSILASTLDGLRFALQSRTLRTTTAMLPLINAALAMGELTLTAIIIHSTGSAVVVGAVRGLGSIVEISSNLLGGRIASQGKEPRIIGLGLLGQAVVYGVVAAVPLRAVVATAVVAAAALTGPIFVTFTSVIQRSTDPALYARTTSATTILGVMGAPLGAALAGVLLAITPTIALMGTAAFVLAAALLTLTLPPSGTLKASPAAPSDTVAP